MAHTRDNVRRFFTYNGLRLEETGYLSTGFNSADVDCPVRHNITISFRVPESAGQRRMDEIARRLEGTGHVLGRRGQEPMVVTSQCALVQAHNCRDTPGGRPYRSFSWGFWARPQTDDERFREEIRKMARV